MQAWISLVPEPHREPQLFEPSEAVTTGTCGFQNSVLSKQAAMWRASRLVRAGSSEGQVVPVEQFVKAFEASHPSWLQMWGCIGTAGFAVLLTSVSGTWAAATSVMSGNLQYLRDDMVTAKKDLSAMKQDLHTLSTDVATLQQDVAILNQDVAGIKQGLANIDTLLATPSP